MIVKIVYRKTSTGSFITLESELKSEDANYVYLECGKYLKKNIISLVIVKDTPKKEEAGEVLTDDA